MKLNSTLATKFIFIITWASEMDFIDTCGSFLKLYNKGTIPSPDMVERLNIREEYIQQNTYFGMLLKDVYDLRQQALKVKEISFNQKIEKLNMPINNTGTFNLLSLI